MLSNPRDARTVRRPAPAPVDDLLVPRHVDEPVVMRLAEGDPEPHPTGGPKILAVFVGRSDSYHEGRLPVAGRYERDGDVLRFTPAFGFVAGHHYVVRTRHTGARHRLTEFHVPAGAVSADALVTGVYPSGSVLPENVLRFYVHFSVPMAPHLASEFVKLHDAAGVADAAAFMRFKQELWSEDRTRLTVLLDPGRIKRSVATNLDLGPALLEGKRYELTVGGGWPSADGTSRLPPFSKSFSVAAPLREQPDVGLWRWRSPRPGTRESLEITFDRPFDRHSLSEALHVVARDGRTIDGTPRIGEDESSWHFTPDDPWTAGDLRVTVNDALEDIAGNSFRDLLDRDMNAAHRGRALKAMARIRPSAVSWVTLPFAAWAVVRARLPYDFERCRPSATAQEPRCVP